MAGVNKISLLLLLLLAAPVQAGDYEDSIEAFHQKRLERLKRHDGWLTLVGLSWLPEGVSTVGSAADCRLRVEAAPAHLGQIVVEGEQITFEFAQGISGSLNGEPVSKVVLDPTVKEGTQVLAAGSLSWYLLRRNGKPALRWKDSQAETLTTFPGIERFPVNPGLRLEGRLERSTTRLEIPTVMGYSEQEISPGQAVFDYQGQTYRLHLTGDPEDQKFFLVFSDETSGKESYAAGRFLYVERLENDRLLLDFNKAYLPPCAFTPYATCPRPPRGNSLPFAVPAGEKNLVGADH